MPRVRRSDLPPVTRDPDWRRRLVDPAVAARRLPGRGNTSFPVRAHAPVRRDQQLLLSTASSRGLPEVGNPDAAYLPLLRKTPTADYARRAPARHSFGPR